MATVEKKTKRKLIHAQPEKTTLKTQVRNNTTIQDSFLLEEAEALERNSKEDLALFKDTCKDIKQIVDEVFQLKKLGDEKANAHQTDACLKFILLKKLNRLDKHRIKSIRDNVSESKQKVDNFHLQLQNLQYEVIHLQKEASKCMDFRSRDEEIDLISKEEFYREAPESISRPDVNKQDVHQETLGRLEWELELRKNLAEQCTKMEHNKKALVQEIDKKKDSLNNLQPTLKTILHATQPLHMELGLPLQSTQIQHKAANLLPRSLYVLYVQSCAYKETIDPLFNANIIGNEDEAKCLSSNGVIDEDSGDSDEETTTHHRRPSKKDFSGPKLVLAKHPLSVQLTLSTKDDYALCLEMIYLTNLHIVTVKVTSVQSPQGVGAGDVLETNKLLHDLLGPDQGQTCPNPANNFLLSKHGVTFNPEVVGYPYSWAQRMAGLQFLATDPSKPSFSCDPNVSNSCMESIVTALKDRLVSRVSLHSQLLSFERGSISLPPQIISIFPTKIVASLKHWCPSSWDKVMQEHPHVNHLAEKEIVSEHDFIFEFNLERGSGQLSGFVLIPCDYPKKTPVFLVSVNWQFLRFPHTDGALWELEQDVNLFPFTQSNLDGAFNHILSIQLQKLLVNFDIYLETEVKEDIGPKEFSLDRVFLRNSRGPSRSKPYYYIQNLGVFSHDE